MHRAQACTQHSTHVRKRHQSCHPDMKHQCMGMQAHLPVMVSLLLLQHRRANTTCGWQPQPNYNSEHGQLLPRPHSIMQTPMPMQAHGSIQRPMSMQDHADLSACIMPKQRLHRWRTASVRTSPPDCRAPGMYSAWESLSAQTAAWCPALCTPCRFEIYHPSASAPAFTHSAYYSFCIRQACSLLDLGM